MNARIGLHVVLKNRITSTVKMVKFFAAHLGEH